jgi:type III pantothenate kinase
MDFSSIKLVDIGNTYAKIYHNKKVTSIRAEDFNLKKKFYYISVNNKLNRVLKENKDAINLEKYITLKTSYGGLGVDRKVLCSYIDNGVIVDAGSAITIDIMENKEHKGGYILPGIKSYFDSYENISPTLKVDRNVFIKIETLPQNTFEAINKAVIKSIVMMIKDVSKDKKIYFCGGDGRMFLNHFERAIYKKDLIFDAMKKIIKDSKC